MDKFINILAPCYGEYFSETELTRYLSEIYIDLGVDILYKEKFESKANYLKRNLFQLEDEDAYRVLLFLRENTHHIDEFAKADPTLEKMKNSFPEFSNEASILNENLVKETKHWLENYPKAYEQYVSAEKQYLDKEYKRNLLDNLRLSLELLLKDLVGVDKSIENQDYSAVLKGLKDKGISEELRNMLRLLIDYYAKYQNDFVKHNSLVVEAEIEIIFELTSSVMKFYIRELG